MKNNKAITLVALVITVIILLILAGITISQLTGSGIFEKAQLAEQKSKEAQEKEEGILSDYENNIGEYVNGSRDGQSNVIFPTTDETKQGTVITNTVPYNVKTKVNSITIEKTGLYSIRARFSWGDIEAKEGMLSMVLWQNETVLDAHHKNSVNNSYSSVNTYSTQFLNEGDIVSITILQAAFTDPFTVTSDGANDLKITPIYYVK